MKISARLLLAASLGLALGGCFRAVNQTELSDPAILASIEGRLKAERSLNLRYVDIDVHSRIVTISGLVGSWEERRLIKKLARSTRGVEQVIINIAVQE